MLHINMYIYIHMHLHNYVHMRMFRCIYTYTDIHICIILHIRTCRHIYVHRFITMHVYIYIYMRYIYTHILYNCTYFICIHKAFDQRFAHVLLKAELRTLRNAVQRLEERLGRLCWVWGVRLIRFRV